MPCRRCLNRKGMLMPFWTRTYSFLAVLALLPALVSGTATAAPAANQDSLKVPGPSLGFPGASSVHTVEGLSVTFSGSGAQSDLFPDRLLTISQTNNAPFLSGFATAGPALAPSITLSGRSDSTQAGTYSVFWTLANDSTPPGVLTATTSVVVHDLVPPTGLRAYYVAAPGNVPIGNGTGVLTFVVWDGSGVESDPFAWNGFRVRRTIHGASSGQFEVAGQYVDSVALAAGGYFHVPVSPICFAQSAP